MFNATEWAAIASAFAACGSIGVACFSYRQQRSAARASDIDKNVSRLMVLADEANKYFSAGLWEERTFIQISNTANKIDSARYLIQMAHDRVGLKKEEVHYLIDCFIEHISYELTEAMKSLRAPYFKRDGSYDASDMKRINEMWKQSCYYLLAKEKINDIEQ